MRVRARARAGSAAGVRPRPALPEQRTIPCPPTRPSRRPTTAVPSPGPGPGPGPPRTWRGRGPRCPRCRPPHRVRQERNVAGHHVAQGEEEGTHDGARQPGPATGRALPGRVRRLVHRRASPASFRLLSNSRPYAWAPSAEAGGRSPASADVLGAGHGAASGSSASPGASRRAADERSRTPSGRTDQRRPAKRSFSGTAAPVVSWTRTKVSMPINSPNLSLPILRKKMFSP